MVIQHCFTLIVSVNTLVDRIDLIICLGGDGTVLHVCSLFQQAVPPIMAFKLGSMGFLAPFSILQFCTKLP